MKIARIVTGSVADSVAPTDMASTKDMLRPSSGSLVQRYSIMPRVIAEIKVPAKANVRMVPILRKKFAYRASAIHHLFIIHRSPT